MLGDKQEAKFERVMSAQNTQHIPAFDQVFGSFYLIISAFFFFALYPTLGFLCILGEKSGIWKLSGDLKKEIGGELSLNVTTFQRRDVLTLRRPNVETLRSYDVQPTLAKVAMLSRLI